MSLLGTGGAYILYRVCVETNKWIQKKLNESNKKK